MKRKDQKKKGASKVQQEPKPDQDDAMKKLVLDRLLEPTKSEKIMVLMLLCTISFFITYFTEFYYTDFPTYSRIQQPVSFQIDSQIHPPLQLIAPLIIGLYGYFLMQTNGDLIQIMIFGMVLAFDRSFISFISLTCSSMLIPLFILVSMIYSQKILRLSVYSPKWIATNIFSWSCLLVVLLLRAEGLGCAVGIFTACFISSLSEFLGGEGSKAKRATKMVLYTYGMALPLFIAFTIIRRVYSETPYINESIDIDEVSREFDRHESMISAVACISGIIVIKFFKPRYVSVIPLIQTAIGAIATALIPYQTPGNPIQMRIMIIKLMMMIFSGVVVTHLKSEWMAFVINGVLLIGKATELIKLFISSKIPQ